MLVTNATGAIFFVAEIAAFAGPGQPIAIARGWNSAASNTLSLTPFAAESSGTLVASDVGYVSSATDPLGVLPYPPVLTQAFQIDREVALEPGQTAAAAGWGTIILANDDGRWDGIAAQWNADGRAVSILRGVKTWDDGRGIWLDPPRGALVPVFAGVATPWFLDADSLRIPIRDATYWLERPLQTNQYGGGGGYDGTATLAGKPKPKTRGGNLVSSVRNVTPVLIDPINLVYQYSDGPGTIVRLYEGGATTIVFSQNVTNLYTGTTAPGHYRTDNARAAFQLGSVPVHTITVDVTGAFPVAGVADSVATLAALLLTEDMALPPGNLDAQSFIDAAVLFPYTAGIYFDPDTNVDGVTAISQVLSSFGAKLIADRTGRLRCLVLRGVVSPSGTNPVGTGAGFGVFGFGVGSF